MQPLCRSCVGLGLVVLGLSACAEPAPSISSPFDAGLRLRVEAEAMRLRAIDELTSAFALGTRAFTFVVNPREESYLRGNQNENLRQLKEQFRLERVVVVADEEQPPGELRVLAGELTQIPPLPSRRRAKKAS